MNARDGAPQAESRGEQAPAVPVRVFSQLTFAVFLLGALLVASALPTQLGIARIGFAYPTATATPTATSIPPTPTPRPLRVYIGTPTPTPLPITPTPAVTRFVVGNTGGDGVWLRRTPRLDDPFVAWHDGTLMEVVGEDAEGDGVTFKQVRDPRGNVGYVPSQYLLPAP